MEQVSRKSDLNPPNVESRCILANYIKSRSTWTKARDSFCERERNELLVASSSNSTKPKDEHLAILRLFPIEYIHFTLETDLTINFCYIIGT